MIAVIKNLHSLISGCWYWSFVGRCHVVSYGVFRR